MSTSPLSTTSLLESPTVARLRLLLGIAVVFGLLLLTLGGYVLPRGLQRPPVFLPAEGGWLGALILLVVLWAGTAVALPLSGRLNPGGAVFLAATGLLLWTVPGGTMTDWLINWHERPGPPTGEPYWALIGDYALLTLIFAGVTALGAWPQRRGEIGRTLHLRNLVATWQRGLAALGVTTALALALLWPLAGPPEHDVHRLQVIFAVLVAFALATLLTHYLVGRVHPLWLWLSPVAAGLIGLIVAGLNPALVLEGAYADLNIKPAWWAVRPLPVEMVAVGLIAIIWVEGMDSHFLPANRPGKSGAS